MHFNHGTLASLALAFATLGNGHLIMKTPVPFGVSTLNNSPLLDADPWQAGSGSDYPCKQRPGVYDITKMNTIPVDTPQELSFIGSASHGGGTCQLAVTMDKEPDVNSVFKLIQVFEGGCPIDSDGNGETHPFSFTIPKEFPNGVATLAWAWYNRIGNREIYMNCAPITVTGGSDSKDFFNSLPNMYLINLPTSQCQSTFEFNSNAVTIPHPGQYIMTEFTGQEMHAATGPNCSAKAAAMLDGVVGYKASPIITTNGAAYNAPGGTAAPVPSGSGSPSGSAMPSGGASGAPSAAPSGAASGSAPAGSAAPSSASGGMSSAAGSAAPSGAASGAPSSAAGGSGLVTISTAAPSGAAPSGSASPSASAGSSGPAGSAAPSAAPSASASAAPSGAAPSGAAPSGTAPSGSTSCTAASSSGMTCSSDGKQFGVCADGKMVWRAVAPGTTCSGGQITKRRVPRHPHVRKHVQRSYVH